MLISQYSLVKAVNRFRCLGQAVVSETRFRFTHSLSALLPAGECLLAVALFQHGFGDRVG